MRDNTLMERWQDLYSEALRYQDLAEEMLTSIFPESSLAYYEDQQVEIVGVYDFCTIEVRPVHWPGPYWPTFQAFPTDIKKNQDTRVDKILQVLDQLSPEEQDEALEMFVKNRSNK